MNFNIIIKNASRVSSYIMVAFIGLCIGCVCCNSHTTFSSIAITPSITKAVEIQNFIEKANYRFTKNKKFKSFADVSIGHFDNNYILTPNFDDDYIKAFDDLTIMLAESDIVDDSVIIGFNYKYTNNKKLATKRIEKSIVRRLEKVKSVMFAKAIVRQENDEMFITVDVSVFRTDKNNIEDVISRLVPVDKNHKKINVRYIK